MTERDSPFHTLAGAFCHSGRAAAAIRAAVNLYREQLTQCCERVEHRIVIRSPYHGTLRTGIQTIFFRRQAVIEYETEACTLD